MGEKMNGAKYLFIKWWHVILTVSLIVFNVGYTVKALEDKPDMVEVKQEINTALYEYKNETKDSYIKIDQVPGLNEKIDAINKMLSSIDKRIEKLENKIWR